MAIAITDGATDTVMAVTAAAVIVIGASDRDDGTPSAAPIV